MKTLLAVISETSPTPGWGPASDVETKVERQLAKAVGIRQFGVNHLLLKPGGESARRHWHEHEDEFVFVLSGVVTLHDGNGAHEIGQGAYVGFPASTPNGHHFINRSDADVELLVMGTRWVGEERIRYPDQADPGPFSVFRNSRGDRVGGPR
ncbi:MAG TPA: cupin domain-containing protein [Caulobacteraceae bacterium]|jgi:uncharacterized cupin superfamily protein